MKIPKGVTNRKRLRNTASESTALCRDKHGSGLDRTASGLKAILAGSGLDRTTIVLKIGESGLDRTEKICCFDVIFLTASKILVVM